MAYTPVGARFEVVLEPFPDAGRRFMVTTGGGQEPVWLSSTELAYRRERSWYTGSIDRPSSRGAGVPASDEAGIDYLGMEYLEGETLAQRLEKDALPLDQALQVAIEIAHALDKAHQTNEPYSQHYLDHLRRS